MTRPRLIAAVLLLLAALTGADGGCRKRGTVQDDRPPAEHQVDPGRERVAVIVADSDQPYQVLVITREVDVYGKEVGGIARSGPYEIGGNRYDQTLRYTSGQRVKIHVTVWGHPADEFFCRIEDGTNVVRNRGHEHVTCVLVTAR
jgi:hypothetical protein